MQWTYQRILGMLAYHEAVRKQGGRVMLESRNHASIVSIDSCGNAETDLLASVVGGRPKGSRMRLGPRSFFRISMMHGELSASRRSRQWPCFIRPSRVYIPGSLLPKEPEATTTPVIKHMSDAQLDAMIARCIEGDLDPTNDG